MSRPHLNLLLTSLGPLVLLSLLGFGILEPRRASALLFDFGSNVAAHTFVPADSSLTGSVIGDPSVLKNGIQYAEAYFLFDYSQVQYMFTNYSPYTLDPSNTSYVRRSTDNYYDPRVDLFTASITLDGTTLPSRFYKYVHEIYLGRTSFVGPDNLYYYTDAYADYVDEFGYVLPLDATLTAEFVKDAKLDFRVEAMGGDFYFQLGKISGMANDAPPTSVPEPSTLLLLGSGLAGLGGVAWKRHRRGQPRSHI